MILSEINTKITQATGADTTSNGYPSATRVIDINSWQHRVHSMILDSQDESDFDDTSNTNFPIKYLSMVAGQRDYSIPYTDKIVELKRVDVSYDGVNFVRATPIDSGEIVDGIGLSTSTTQETTTDGQFSTANPRYDYKYGSIFIYPRATTAQVAAGAAIKYEGSREMTEFTTSDLSTGTAVPRFDSAFHPFLWLGPSYEYCMFWNLPQTKGLKGLMDDLEVRLRRQYGKKVKDRDTQVTGAVRNDK